MADERRSRTGRTGRRYRTYGNVAYQPDYERDNTLRQRPAERVRRQPEIERRPRIQPRQRVAARPAVRVRAQDAVAPFSVVGFAVVLACALLLVMVTARLAQVNYEIVNLRGEMSDLKDEEQQLQTQYELLFDLEAIENTFTSNGSMVRPGAGQTIYLDTSAGDSVVYYDGGAGGLSGLVRQAQDFLSGLLPWQ